MSFSRIPDAFLMMQLAKRRRGEERPRGRSPQLPIGDTGYEKTIQCIILGLYVQVPWATKLRGDMSALIWNQGITDTLELVLICQGQKQLTTHPYDGYYISHVFLLAC